MAEKKSEYSKLGTKYIDILKKGKISESEIIALKSFLNSGKASDDEEQKILDLIADGIDLEKSQQKKGVDWLISQYKTPTGKLKDKHPFGSREIFVLENWDSVSLSGLNNKSYVGKNYQPEYYVRTKEGTSFGYDINSGKINITI